MRESSWKPRILRAPSGKSMLRRRAESGTFGMNCRGGQVGVRVPHLENLRDAKEQSEILFETTGHGDIVADGQHALPRGPEVLGIAQPDLLLIGLRSCASTGERLSAAECASVADRDGRLDRRRHRVPHLRGYIASDPYISTVCRILAQTLVTRAGLVVIAI